MAKKFWRALCCCFAGMLAASVTATLSSFMIVLDLAGLGLVVGLFIGLVVGLIVSFGLRPPDEVAWSISAKIAGALGLVLGGPSAFGLLCLLLMNLRKTP